MKKVLFLISLGLIITGTSHAGEADVTAVGIKDLGNRIYTFEVTVSHQDEGWNHYADRWEIIGPDGIIYGTRTLLHPHVEEQPFTRSMSGVKIPAVIKSVKVRAHDSIHKYGGAFLTIAIEQ